MEYQPGLAGEAEPGRFNKNELTEKIQRIALYRDVVAFTSLDARMCVPKWAKALPSRALMNIDPPYFAKGRDLYMNLYTADNHADLARIIRRLKCQWMLTYDDVPEIPYLYSGLPMYRKGLVYYAQAKRRASELLMMAPRLTPPMGLV